MPQHKSCFKRIRVTKRQNLRNRAVRSELRNAIRNYVDAPVEEKTTMLRSTISIIDNAVRKGILKNATADRRKSRLTKLLNRQQKEASV